MGTASTSIFTSTMFSRKTTRLAVALLRCEYALGHPSRSHSAAYFGRPPAAEQPGSAITSSLTRFLFARVKTLVIGMREAPLEETDIPGVRALPPRGEHVDGAL